MKKKKSLKQKQKKWQMHLQKNTTNKGYNLGVKKVKEELEKGEKALAINFKNL